MLSKPLSGRVGGSLHEKIVICHCLTWKLNKKLANRFDRILVAAEGVKIDISECTERSASAEVRISNMEDNVVSLHAKAQSLEDAERELEDKVTDFEARSRRS